MLTLLTPTGTRPQAFALCERWMARQTYQGPVHWVIVDDGPEAQPVTFAREGWTVEVLRPEPVWYPGQNTQHRNFLAGLERIDRASDIAIIEDDDWYHPGWLERVARELRSADVVGQCFNRYYHVRTRQIEVCANDQHAGLSSTAFKGPNALEVFVHACVRGRRLVDIQMWRHAQNRRLFWGEYVIGMKGLPGRKGIAGGHAPEPHRLQLDLSEWIGDDAAAYAQFR